MSSKRDYYEVLGVEREAGADEINKAYRKLALQLHPDRNPGDPEATERFKEASEANDVLSSPEKRRRYDRYGHAGLQNGAGGESAGGSRSIFEFIEDMFNTGGGGPRSGRDIQVVVDLTLEESFRGVKKSVSYQREENCGDCGGSRIRKGARPPKCKRCNGAGAEVVRGFFGLPQQQMCRACGGLGMTVFDADLCSGCRGRGRATVTHKLEIDVPPGVDTRDGMPVAHEGHAGEPGAQSGDLICVFRVAEHKVFRRQGIHLMLAEPIPLTFADAALGTTIEIPTLDGSIEHPLKPGTQGGTRLQFEGKGMPDVKNPRRRGDLLVPVAVITPRKLTPRQRELLMELGEIDEKNAPPERKSFLDKVRNFLKGDGKE